jgi:NAD(P)-dependent dehydrogenase (short-subunit alcohol dehydrogenase family)
MANNLHVLVNNAGVGLRSRQVSADGLEMTFAVNHMGYFLPTVLLLDTLRAAAPARVVNVASELHRRGRLDFEDLQLERGYSQYRAYANSKLANVLFTYALARRIAGSGVTANCLHPGMVATRIWREAPWVMRKLLPLLLKSPAAGARTAIQLAASRRVEGLSGRYFIDGKEAQSSPASRDAALADRLWRVSEQSIA